MNIILLFPSSKLSSLKAQIDEEDVKSIFVGATKYEILHYLEDAKERGVDVLQVQDDAENVRIKKNGQKFWKMKNKPCSYQLNFIITEIRFFPNPPSHH